MAAEALGGLAPRLEEPERSRALSEAVSAAREIGDERARARALSGLAPHLGPGSLSEAVAAARAIGDKPARARALSGLAPRLEEPERSRALSEAVSAARAIGDERRGRRRSAAWCRGWGRRRGRGPSPRRCWRRGRSGMSGRGPRR